MSLKVLVTGGSGLLAVNLAHAKKKDWYISLFVRNHEVSFEDIATYKMNLENREKLLENLKAIRPDVIIHTAGLADVGACEEKRFEAYLSNVLISRNISRAANLVGSKFVHISTDHFSNSKKPYSSEEEIEVPVNNYAKTKLEAEYEVLSQNPDALIIRTNFYGWGHSFRSSFSDWIIDSLRRKEKINLFQDVFFTPVLIDDLMVAIEGLVVNDVKGIFNISSDERISKYDFGIKLAKIFDLDSSLIGASFMSEAKNLTRRPFDMSLSCDKLRSILPSWKTDYNESFKVLKAQEFQGRRQEFIRSVNLSGKSPLISYGTQYIDDHDIDAVIRTMTSNYLTQGPKVTEFEEKIADYVGAKYAVAVSNLTTGMHIAMLAAGVGTGDESITSPITFVTSANAAAFVNAIPHFSDIDLETINLCPKKLEVKAKELQRLKSIIPVHFGGHPCDMEAIKKIADKHKAIVIEDAAHALGGTYPNGKKIGSCEHSLMTGFSFHPVKSITTGEGGVITTNSEEVYKELMRLRSHGINKGNDGYLNELEAFTEGIQNPWYYEMQKLGYNYRLTDIQASLGLAQMDKLDFFMKKRRDIAKVYDEEFRDLSHLKVIQQKTRSISGNHLYMVMIDFEGLKTKRKYFHDILRGKGVFAHVHYIPVPIQPYYQQNFPTNPADYANAMTYYRKATTLPLHPRMTEKEVSMVVNSVKDVINQLSKNT